MADDDVTPQPVPFLEAFRREDDDALMSQAASLLLLGAQLDEEPVAFETVRSLEGEDGLMALAPPEDIEPLQVPRVGPSRARYKARGLRERAFAMATVEPGVVAETPMEAAILQLAEAVEAEPTPANAATLVEMACYHRHELVRVAAAIASQPMLADPTEHLSALVEGISSEDPLVRDLAATGLARFDPQHPALSRLVGPSEPSGDGEPTRTSLLVHGTWAKRSEWWQPGGSFHTYLKQEVRPDLYSAADRFAWSGRWSDHYRALGATDLVNWVNDHDLHGLDLFAHSHGGNVAMLATQQGLDIGQLVLLACPVHWNKYSPDFDRVGRVLSIRVRLDLVILGDRGGQRFRDPRIEEHVLPIWFNHFSPRRANIWEKHDLPSLL